MATRCTGYQQLTDLSAAVGLPTSPTSQAPMHLLAARLRQLAAAAEALAPLIDSEQSGPPRAVGSLPVARSLPAAVADPPPAGGRGAKQRAVAEFLAANSNAEIEEIQAAIGCSRSTASAARKNFLEGDGSKKSN